MEIYGCTYSEYKEQYAKRLSLYKDRFEDRDESIFLEREIINFKDFHNVLVSIYNSFIKNKSYNNLITDPQYRSHLSYLQNNYNNVFNELFQIGPPLLDANKSVSHPDDIKEEDIRGYFFYFDVTKEKLDNIITSTKRILDFIKKKYKNLQTSDIPENVKVNKDSVNSEEHKQYKPKKYSAKWHALQYLLELKSKGLKPPVSTEGAFIKSELEAIGKSRTGLKGQGFYKAVKKYYKDLDNPTILKNSFGKDWKDKIIELFNDNDLLKDYINNNY